MSEVIGAPAVPVEIWTGTCSGVKGGEGKEGRGQQLEYKSRIKKKFIFIKMKKPAAAVDEQQTDTHTGKL